MPDIKFSQLEVVTTAASNDSIPIIDASNPLMSENGSNAIISVGDFADSLFDGLSDGALSSSKIQTNPTFTGDVTLPITTTIGDVTGTEIGFLSGCRSNIQTQIDNQIFGGILDPSAVGLGNVTNESKETMFTSPSFTGTPLSTTAVVDTNTTQIATTSFVIGQAASTTPIANGTATVGSSLRYARADHIHPRDTTLAPLASPSFTGTPLAPTAPEGTNTTQIATTAYVQGEFTSIYNNILEVSDASLTVSSTHYNKYIRLSNSGGITINLPMISDIPIGTTITFRRTTDAGALSLSAASGVTINDNDIENVLGGDTFAIKYIANNMWDFI